MKISSEELLKSAISETGKELKLANKFEYPRVTRIILHIGTGKIRSDEKTVENIKGNLAKISGQTPSYTLSHKSIASFKVRKGERVGLRTTLRGIKVDHFLTKFIKTALPAIRDFKGVSSSSFDRQGNLNIGIREISVFPEISFSDQGGQSGLQITLVFNTKNLDHIKILLNKLGFPFKKS